MWVCAHSDPATTATGSSTRSSHSTAHTHTRNSTQNSTGMYGFQG